MIPQTHHVPGGVETESSIHSGDSNFLDLEWLSTSGNSSDERSIAISTPDVNLSAENVISGINSETMVSICSQQFDSAKFCSLILLKFVQTNSGD
jgi:hypothetical protein